MDRNTEDRKSGLPSKGPQDELEEALKWLEELTNRKGKAAEPSSSTPSASIESPFRGLIESEEGDLPDWLREGPSLPNLSGNPEMETESRLDWLAKMAQRESIEELPTLEWRRLGEPMQSALLPPSREGTQDVSFEEPEDEPQSGEEVSSLTDSLPSEDPLSWLSIVDQGVEEPESEVSQASDEFSSQALKIDPQLDLEFDAEDELPSLDDLDAAMAWIEELAASQDAPIEDIPSVVDRALASKLMIDTSASQSVSPLDELGSDTDMLEDFTPTHPFIEEEDLADTVVLVETMASEQGLPVEVPEAIGEKATDESQRGEILDAEEQEFISESSIVDEGADFVVPPVDLAPGDLSWGEEAAGLGTLPDDLVTDDMSFEEAMAYLDEIAVEQERDLETFAISDEEDLAIIDEIVHDVEEYAVEDIKTAADLEVSWKEVADSEDEERDEPLAVTVELAASDFTPWDDEVDITGVSESAPSTAGRSVTALESTLMTLDVLALPEGKSLDDIDASLRMAQMAPLRDVSSALDWLETALVQGPAGASDSQMELDEDALIAQMPEDPDAVLAWLEQVAGEDTAAQGVKVIVEDESETYMTGDHPAEPYAEELENVDLLDMPEDPDEAMAWLEGLARGEAKPKVEEVGKLIEDMSAEVIEIGEAEEISAEVADIEEDIAEAITAEAEGLPVDLAKIGEAEEISAEVADIEEHIAEAITVEADELAVDLAEIGEAEEISAEVADIEEHIAEAITVEAEELAVDLAEIGEAEEISAEGEEFDWIAVGVAEVEESEAEMLAAERDEVEAIVVEEIVEYKGLDLEQPATSKPMRHREKPESAEMEGPSVAAEGSALAEEAAEIMPATKEQRADFSWIDLLKPLD